VEWRDRQALLTPLGGEPMTDSDRRPNGADASSPPLRVVHGARIARHRASFGPVADLIGRVAETDVTVLLRGERGTGKELVARAIHGASPRHERPFVKIDCASQMVEIELFGFERGAVVAGHHRPGRIEFAHHGTLFLDRVSELPSAVQLRLHRALEEGGFARPGARDAVRADVRVIASSERDLERAVAEGRFREALFFRLNVVCLTLPPLRQRRTELKELAAFFVRQYAAHYNKPEVSLSHETLRLFSEYQWPANLQELEDVVKRIVMLGSEETVREELTRAMRDAEASADHRVAGTIRPPGEAKARLPDATGPPVPGAVTVPAPIALKEIARQAADGAERELIFRTLQRTRWNRREAAQMLGVSYKALLYKIKRAELDGEP
jgi:transcriptional regulator with GAF, ATPase, and Fis domain